MNFEHRSVEYNDNEATGLDLVDSVLNISSRASAVLLIMQTQFLTEMRVNDEVNCQALESVILDIADIQTVIKHFDKQRK